MPLHILAGRAGSGKSFVCIDSLAKLLRGRGVHSSVPSAFLLVPEQFTLQAERNLLDHPSCPGLLRDEVLSFKRMAFRVLNQTGGLRKKRLAPSGRVMLLMKVLGECSSSLRYYSDLREKPWEAGKLLGLLDEFGRYEVGSAILEELGAREDLDSSLRIKCRDLSLLYTGYRTLLTEDYADDEDIYRALLDRLVRYRPFAGACIWLDEFSGFTSFEFDIIQQLLEQCAEVHVCLCLDRSGDPLFGGIRRTYERLLELAELTHVPVQTTFLDQKGGNVRFRSNRYLAHVEEQFCSYPSAPLYGKPQGITVLECKTLTGEVEASAREILRLCREESLRFGDIAVAARQLGDYERIIRAVYTRYGIPFFMDDKKEIESHPFVRSLLDGLSVLADDWSYEAVFGFLKAGLYPASPAAVDRLENIALERGLQGRTRWSHVLDLPERPEVEELRARLFQQMEEFRSALRGCRNIADCCSALCSFLARLGMREQLERQANEWEEAGRREEAEESRRIWNMVMEVLEQLFQFLGEEPIRGVSRAAETLRTMLMGGFSQYRAGHLPQSADHVQVGTADRSRTTAVKALLVLGANEGKFPASFSDDGLLSDRDRETLAQCGVTLAEDNHTRARLEQFLIYKVLTSPSRFLHVSYALEDSGGAVMRPSLLVRRLRRIFPDLILEKEYQLTPLRRLTNPGPFLMSQSGWMLEPDLDGEERQLQGAVRRWYEKSPLWAPLYRRLQNARQKNGVPADWGRLLLDPKLAEQLFFLEGTPSMTVSRIETYNRCPFSFYLLYGFGAKPRKEHEMAAPEMGTFVHTLIDKASHLFLEEGHPLHALQQSDCDRLIESVTESALDELGTTAFTGSARNAYMTDRLKRFAKGALFALSRQLAAGHYQASGFEVSFGMGNSEFPPVPVDCGNGKTVLLRGRIDRYDVMEKDGVLFVRVVDYKSSERDIAPGDVVNGMKIQLVTYLEALKRGLEEKEKKKVVGAAALYFTLKEDWNVLDQHPEEEASPVPSYKMNGFLLDDPDVLLSMVEKDPGEPVASIRVKKDGEATVTSPSGAVPPGGFELLFEKVHEKIGQAVTSLSQGDISVLPRVTKDSDPCDYCDYAAVCGRMAQAAPPSLSVRKPSAEEVWKDTKDR